MAKKSTLTKKQVDAQAAYRASMAHTIQPGFEPVAHGEPTTAKPGSTEKLEVLRERAEKGLILWNPKDPVLQHAMRERAEWVGGYRGHRLDQHVVDKSMHSLESQ